MNQNASSPASMPPPFLQSVVKLPSGASIPVLGLGVYQNKDDCLSACLAALKNGYRHIDSAIVYKNEEEVGQAVKQSGLKREEVFITSKITSKLMGDTAGEIEKSLAKLDTEYIDLFLLHDPLAGSDKRLAAYRALWDKQKEGKVKDIGVSNFGVRHLEELLGAGLPTPAVNQIEMHPRSQFRDIVEFCRSKNILIQAYCPIARGEYLDDPTLVSVAESVSRTPAQVLIRWSLQKGFIPLPKSTSEARIKQNADVLDFDLDDGQMATLDGMDKGKEGSVSWGGAVVEWKD